MLVKGAPGIYWYTIHEKKLASDHISFIIFQITTNPTVYSTTCSSKPERNIKAPGNASVTSEFSSQKSIIRKAVPCHDGIMLMTGNAPQPYHLASGGMDVTIISVCNDQELVHYLEYNHEAFVVFYLNKIPLSACCLMKCPALFFYLWLLLPIRLNLNPNID